MDISSGKYIVLGFIVVYGFFYFRWVFRDRRIFVTLFKNDKYFDDYDINEVKRLTNMLIRDLSTMYGTEVPKWKFNDLTKDNNMGLYITSLKTIYFDYEMLNGKEFYMYDWFDLVTHEFTHYFDHITLEKEGKDFSEVYVNLKDFYEMRANSNAKKTGRKLYLNYLRDGKI